MIQSVPQLVCVVEQYMLQVSCRVNLVSVSCPSVAVAGSKYQHLLVVPLYAISSKPRHRLRSPLLGVLRWSFETNIVGP
jgi:hypothetical protein